MGRGEKISMTRQECIFHTKEYLENYNELAISIQDMKKARELKLSLEETNKDTLGKILELEHEIRKVRNIIDKINNIIFTMRPVETAIIEARYMNKNQWKDVAKEVNYSVAQCKRLSNVAVSRIAVALFGIDAMRIDNETELKK